MQLYFNAIEEVEKNTSGMISFYLLTSIKKAVAYSCNCFPNKIISP